MKGTACVQSKQKPVTKCDTIYCYYLLGACDLYYAHIILRMLLSTTPPSGAVEEELVTSSDGQSHDSESPFPSSINATPQVHIPNKSI